MARTTAMSPYFPNNMSLGNDPMPELLNNPEMLQSMRYQAPQTGYRVPTSNKRIPKSKGNNLPITTPNWTYYQGPVDAIMDGTIDVTMDSLGKGGGLKGFFANAKAGAGNALKNIKAGKGINPKFAKGATGIAAALSAINAIKGISDYNTEMKNSQDVANDILASASANPNLRYDLTNDQLKMLRQLRNGTYDLSGDLSGASILSGIGNTAIGAGTGFLTGGWGGAIAGGLGGLVDSALGGMQDNQRRITSELEGLYQALYESEMRNKSMERNAAMQRYATGLY